jgi:DNA adenine methylase
MRTLSLESPEPIQPFLKWPGGKRWAARKISEFVRKNLNGTYFEPFLGAGAVFFFVQPAHSVLSDINEDLINTYRAVRKNPDELAKRLASIPVSRTTYYRVRSSMPAEPIGRAARFLYLNRTSFSGLYRVNSCGDFNVPYGGGERTYHILLKTPLLARASLALKRASLRCCDFEQIMDRAKSGDVVYCDPTYTVTHDQNGFIRYNENNFSWSDQLRLARAARRAANKGVRVIVSNAHHIAIRHLYPGATFHTLERHSTLSSDPSKRRLVKELLILL